MTTKLILYDGWALIYQPNSPAALHLLALLENLVPEAQPAIALPAQAPSWMPEGIRIEVIPTPNRIMARIGWEQHTLPGLASRLKAAWLHTTCNAPPLIGPPISLSSPTDFGQDEPLPRGLAERVQRSLGVGGMRRARAILWPEGLPVPRLGAPVQTLPGVVSSLFAPYPSPGSDEAIPAEISLPETFVLYHGPGSKAALDRLLEAWFWAASSIGEYYPLVLAGLSNRAQWRMIGLLEGTTAANHIYLLPSLSPAALAEIYRRCAALIHTAEEPAWGGPVRHALACGKPVVAENHPRCEALVGSAAYLTAANDGRSLGAALITVVLDENLAAQLSMAAHKKATLWDKRRFTEELQKIYRQAHPD